MVAIVREVERRRLLPRLLFEGRAPDLTDDEMLDAIAPHTLQFLIGAECGYDEGLDRVGKGTTCATLEACAAALARHGIAPRADFSFVIGLPWETTAEVRRTVSFAIRLAETYGVRVLFNWYLQIPGSRLWEDAETNELVHESQYDEPGFLRNLALFRSGVTLQPSEIWTISDEIADHAARLGGRWRNRVEFGVPPAIGQWFPRDHHEETDTGLVRLRELARPPRSPSPVRAQVGLPQRRITASSSGWPPPLAGQPRCSSPASGAKRIEAEVAHRVLMGDLRHFVVGEPVEACRDCFRALRKARVGVRKVGLPAKVVDGEVVAALQPHRLVDERQDHLAAENLARQLVTEVLPRPSAVMPVGPIDTLEEERHPSDAAFRQREPHAGEPPQHW